MDHIPDSPVVFLDFRHIRIFSLMAAIPFAAEGFQSGIGYVAL